MIIVQIAGRLGRDPETRFTQSGLKVTSLTVATTVRKGGKEETVWWRVTVWGERFDKMISFLKKGSAIIAIGEMNKPDIWTDKEGRPQVSLELTADIIRFSPFGNPDANRQEGSTQNTQSYSQTQSQPFSQSTPNYSNDNNFGESNGNNTPFNAGGSQYGMAQGTSANKFNQAIPHDEDNLPF